MARKIKKQEAIDTLRSVETDEIQCELIFRSLPLSKKREFVKAIESVIETYVRDTKDVVIFAMKLR
jgi:hypothetical protein